MIKVYKNTILNVFDIVVQTVNFKNTYMRGVLMHFVIHQILKTKDISENQLIKE